MTERPTKNFQDPTVWNHARPYALAIYGNTDRLPRREMCGLTSRMRQAAGSVVANIAEASKKRGKPQNFRLLPIVQASLEASRYSLIRCNDIGYGDTRLLTQQAGRFRQLPKAYIQAIVLSRI